MLPHRQTPESGQDRRAMRACVRTHSPPGLHAVSLAAEGGSKSGRELRAPDYRPGWIAVLATIVGAIVVVLLRQDPFENPDSRAFERTAGGASRPERGADR